VSASWRNAILLALLSLPLPAAGELALAGPGPAVARLAGPGLAANEWAGAALELAPEAACQAGLPRLVAVRPDGRPLLASFGADADGAGCLDPASTSPQARVVAQPGGFAAAWIAGAAGGTRDRLQLAWLDAAGGWSARKGVAEAPWGAIVGVDLAAGPGSSLGVAWVERREAGDRLAFAIVAARDTAARRAELELAAGVRASAPRLAWDGWREQWFVAWSEAAADGAPALRLARVDAGGAAIEPLAALGAISPSAFSIAAGDGVLALALESADGGERRAELRLLALDDDGRLAAVAPPIALTGETAGAAALAPAVAWDGLRGLFLVAWAAAAGGEAAATGIAAPAVALRLSAFDAAGRPVQRAIELARDLPPRGSVALAVSAGRPLALWGAPDAALAVGVVEDDAPGTSGPPSGPLPLLDCTPSDELCDGTDNDCDGSTDEETGPRWVAPTGSDAGNLCTSQAAPCATIGRAVAAACAGETVNVAEGIYAEDLTIDKPLLVDGSGIAPNTQLTGSNTRDVLRILSGGVTWDGIEVSGAPAHACVRVGDATHLGLRDVFVQNMAAYGCRQGILLDGTGSPTGDGQWNRLLAVDLRDAVADGAPDGGVGLLAVNGNGKLEVKVSLIRNNAGSGVRIKAPGSGQENRTIVFAGDFVQANGSASLADGRAGIEIAGASEVRFEGNDVSLHTGDGSGDDGRGVLLTDVASGTFYCNRIRQNDTGLNLRGSTGLALRVEQSHFLDHGFAGVLAEAPALLTLERSIVRGNATGLENRGGTAPVAARENWWGAASGPAPGGAGDLVLGLVDTTGFIARATAPWLARRPADSGWDSSPDLCYQRIQSAIDAALDGDLILAGPGTYPEHLVLGKRVDVLGTAAPAGCPLTVVDATQDPGQHLPGMRVSGVTGLRLENLDIRSAGEGNPCGAATGDEIGLDFVNVSNTSVTNLCLSENGVTELRLYGNSDANTFTSLKIDGMIRNFAGEDACGHRSREGILVDGGPACEGGPGAFAEGNAFRGGSIANVARGASLKLARSTELSGLTIDATPAPLWGAGNAYGVQVALAEDTLIDACTLASVQATDQVRIEGRDAASCVTELTDSARTTVSNSTIRRALQAGVHFHRGAGDPGAPILTRMSCNEITQNIFGVLSDAAGIAPASDNALTLNNIRGNTTNGVRNTDIPTLDAKGNFWGASNGPSGAGPGSGDSVAGSVTFSPWLTSSVFNDFDGDTFSECGGDCNDTVAAIRPGATELCDGIDNDCDGSVDEGGLTRIWYRDLDEDGFGDAAATQATACGAPAPPGYVADDRDCDDGNAARFPGNPEICDALDNDCDATVDEGLPQNTYYRDADGDGYGDPAQTKGDCAATPPSGYVAVAGDCNDGDRAVNPGAVEICTDAIDNDCDGSLDAQDTPCSGLGVTNLRFAAGTRTDLTWNAAPAASSYAVLRGAFEGGGFAYNHRCLASELPAPNAQDTAVPVPGAVYYYLATGLARNATTGDLTGGPLGTASSGAPRPDSASVSCGPRVYVDPDAAGAGNGLSWADAYTTISAALGHETAPSRGLEIWAKGASAGNNGVLAAENRPGAMVLGGFSGTESLNWQRNPAANPTSWAGQPTGPLLTLDRASIVVDGVTLGGAPTAIDATVRGGTVELRGVTANGFTARAVDLRADSAAGATLVVVGSSFGNGGAQAIRAVASAGTLGGVIRGSTFDGGSDAALRLEARPAAGAATVALKVESNTVRGGAAGIVVGAHGADNGFSATNASAIASNLVRTTTSDALRVEASGTYAAFAGTSAVRAVPTITGNTLTDAGGAGLVCSATRADTSGAPASHEVRAAPQAWDNLITFNAAQGIRESADDPAQNLVADPVAIGNGLFGNAALYLDEGTTTLPAIGDVNALNGNRENWSADPLYVNRAGRDYRLQSGSPAIDRGHVDAPGQSTLDASGGPRWKGSAPDTGAYER
jgi:hypothetical protein